MLAGEIEVGNEGRPWVGHVSAGGELDWSWQHDASGFARGVAVSTDGSVWVTGGLRTADGFEVWVGRIVDGELEELTKTAPGQDGWGVAIGVGPAGQVYVAESWDVGNGRSVTVRRLDEADPWTDAVPAAGHHDDVSDMAVLSDGSCVVVGSTTVEGAARPWLRRYLPNGSVDWTLARDMGSLDGRVASVTRSPTDALIYTGTYYAYDGPLQHWLELADADGQVGWSVLDPPLISSESGVDVSLAGESIVSSVYLADFDGVLAHGLDGTETDRWSNADLGLAEGGVVLVAGLSCGRFYLSQYPDVLIAKIDVGCGG